MPSLVSGALADQSPLRGVCFHVFFFNFHMKTIVTLGKHNRTRGVITWRFCQSDAGDWFALRNDGRRYSYIDINDAREGFRTLRRMGFAHCELLAV